MTFQNQSLIFQQNFAVPFSSEQRSYLIIRLPNGIQGLLITDPCEDVASCCLTVATGHHANPKNICGLAHLCEHMISLSSKEYPEIDAYRNLVYQVGGTRNAVTNNETTSFFFSVPITSSPKEQSEFEKVLSIFTSNFRNPNFEITYSNREIYAIDNEHAVNKTRSNRLLFQGFKLLANNEHPFSMFSTGNLDSLIERNKKVDIRERLLDFFKAEYTPDKMSFVLRGPQSLNYLQRLATLNFSKIGILNNRESFTETTMKPKVVPGNAVSNKVKSSWKEKYNVLPYLPADLQKGVLIKKDIGAVLRIAFPVTFDKTKFMSKKRFNFYINFWCELFGSESQKTIASALFGRELVSAIVSKTSSVTYDTTLLELELSITDKGYQYISTILDVIFNFASLFNASESSKFIKHLAKSMSQFNGIGIYNFLFSEASSESIWEVQKLSRILLEGIQSYGRFLLKGQNLMDETVEGFKGAYTENKAAKNWWLDEAKRFSHFIKNNISINRTLLSFVGDIDKTELDWAVNIPAEYTSEPNFEFNYKVVRLNSQVIDISKINDYGLDISPPNIFADEMVDDQTALLGLCDLTTEHALDASLGYSVKNTSSSSIPILYHCDFGCQLWLKKEVDVAFKNKALLTLELINTKIGASPTHVAVLEILVQLVKFRVNEYLYPATVLNYVYDLFPSFKGETGVLLHVSGPKENFAKVLKVLVYEVKLISESFGTTVTDSEFTKAKAAVLLKYSLSEKMSTFESATLGLMATIEENTWLLQLRIEACQNLTKKGIASVTSKIFESCYLTAFLQGDIEIQTLSADILPIISKLVKNFEGENYRFPSSVFLPPRSNYYVNYTSNDATNGIECFFQTCRRDDIKETSITKFVSYLLGTDLTRKLRTDYQLGYIVLVGLRTLRKTQGIHILIISSTYSSDELDSKLEDILAEWYEQSIKKLKNAQLSQYIDKFVTAESATGSSTNSNSGCPSLFFGALGSSGGDKKITKQHNSYWEQIDNKTYSFSKTLNGGDGVDLDVVKNITTESLTQFIKQKLLPISAERSKITIRIDSKLPKEEFEKNSKGMQLYFLLSSMGFPIKQEHLEDILEKSNNSQIKLCKSLYRYYRENGKSISQVASVIAKLSKSVLLSGKTEAANNTAVIVPPKQVDIENLSAWKKQTGYVQEQIQMKDRLNSFRDCVT